MGTGMSVRGFGYKPDPHDSRDHWLPGSMRAALLPVAAETWNPVCAPKDQGATSSCVGQAVAQGLRLAWLHLGQACPELSALEVYDVARSLEGEPGIDNGTYIRLAIGAVQKGGVCDEAAWPFSAAKINTPLPLRVVRAGWSRRGLRHYYRIANGDTQGIRAALAAGLPVVGGWAVTQSFEDWNPTKGPISKLSGAILGGHAMCIHGYNRDVFHGVNSWGPDWGRGGHWDATAQFISHASDLWALDVRA